MSRQTILFVINMLYQNRPSFIEIVDQCLQRVTNSSHFVPIVVLSKYRLILITYLDDFWCRIAIHQVCDEFFVVELWLLLDWFGCASFPVKLNAREKDQGKN